MAKLSSTDKYRLIPPILEWEVSMVRVFQSEGIPVRTLSCWAKRFSEKGLCGPRRAKRKDSDSSRILAPELPSLLFGGMEQAGVKLDLIGCIRDI